jgi:hypothetical protein
MDDLPVSISFWNRHELKASQEYDKTGVDAASSNHLH